MKCLICNSQALIPSANAMLYCRDCGLTFAAAVGAPFEYQSEISHKRYEFRYVRKALTRIAKEKQNGNINILEFGCNDGQYLLKIRRERPNTNLTGCDVYFSYSTEAKLENERITIARQFDQIDQKFDLIYSFHALEHLRDPETFLKRAFSLLNEGGFMILSVPNPRRLTRRLFEENWDFPPYHMCQFENRTFLKIAKMFGVLVDITEEPLTLQSSYLWVSGLQNLLHSRIRSILLKIARSPETEGEQASRKKGIRQPKSERSKYIIRGFFETVSWISGTVSFIVLLITVNVFRLSQFNKGLSLCAVFRKGTLW